MDFGKRLRKIREKKGVTQEALAKSLGYENNSYIARVERGDFLPSKENLRKIAAFLRVSFKELDRLLFEAKLKGVGIRDQKLLEFFRDLPYLPESGKRAIINAYLKIKGKKRERKT